MCVLGPSSLHVSVFSYCNISGGLLWVDASCLGLASCCVVDIGRSWLVVVGSHCAYNWFLVATLFLKLFAYICVCGVVAAGFLYPSMLLLFLGVCMLASHLHMCAVCYLS